RARRQRRTAADARNTQRRRARAPSRQLTLESESMMQLRKLLVLLVLVTPCASALAQDSGPIKAPFSDPSRPGSLHVALVTGGVTVVASDTKEVLINVSGDVPREAPPEESRGLRRLTPQPGVTIEERNNRMELRVWPPHREVQLRIQVPRQTQLEISTVN